jgi:hypothetical protein
MDEQMLRLWNNLCPMRLSDRSRLSPDAPEGLRTWLVDYGLPTTLDAFRIFEPEKMGLAKEFIADEPDTLPFFIIGEDRPQGLVAGNTQFTGNNLEYPPTLRSNIHSLIQVWAKWPVLCLPIGII